MLNVYLIGERFWVRDTGWIRIGPTSNVCVWKT